MPSVQGRPASVAPKHSAGPVRAGRQARRHPSCWSRATPTPVHGVQVRIAVNEPSSARSACSLLVSARLRRTNTRGVQQLAGAVGGEWRLGSAGGHRQRDHHSAGDGSVGEARSLGLPTPPPPLPRAASAALQPSRRLWSSTVPKGGRDLAHIPHHRAHGQQVQRTMHGTQRNTLRRPLGRRGGAEGGAANQTREAAMSSVIPGRAWRS